MNQHGVEREIAIQELRRQVTSSWKDLNEELLEPLHVPRVLLMRILNMTRVLDVIYIDSDGYTDSQNTTKDHITALFLDAFPL